MAASATQSVKVTRRMRRKNRDAQYVVSSGQTTAQQYYPETGETSTQNTYYRNIEQK